LAENLKQGKRLHRKHSKMRMKTNGKKEVKQ